jgi:hypothetical protein
MRAAWQLPQQSKAVPLSSKMSDAGTSKREQHLRALADKLLFNVEKSGDRFTIAHGRCLPAGAA